MPKNLKDGTLCDFLTFVLLQNMEKIEGRTLLDIKKFSKKSLTKPKRGSLSAEKIGNHLLRNACKKLPHKHRFEHEPSGLKACILPLDHERLSSATCGLKRESCRAEKKHPHFPITFAYCKCNKSLTHMEKRRS